MALSPVWSIHWLLAFPCNWLQMWACSCSPPLLFTTATAAPSRTCVVCFFFYPFYSIVHSGTTIPRGLLATLKSTMNVSLLMLAPSISTSPPQLLRLLTCAVRFFLFSIHFTPLFIQVLPAIHHPPLIAHRACCGPFHFPGAFLSSFLIVFLFTTSLITHRACCSVVSSFLSSFSSLPTNPINLHAAVASCTLMVGFFFVIWYHLPHACRPLCLLWPLILSRWVFFFFFVIFLHTTHQPLLTHLDHWSFNSHLVFKALLVQSHMV